MDDDEKFHWWIEVDRAGHELSAWHGRNASEYARRLHAEALAEGRSDEAEF